MKARRHHIVETRYRESLAGPVAGQVPTMCQPGGPNFEVAHSDIRRDVGWRGLRNLSTAKVVVQPMAERQCARCSGSREKGEGKRIGVQINSLAGRLLCSLLVGKRPCPPGEPAVDVGHNRLARHGACMRVMCAAVLATQSTTWGAQRWIRNKHLERHLNIISAVARLASGSVRWEQPRLVKWLCFKKGTRMRSPPNPGEFS
eukprot:365444-Chlamydomonas_euryale.AAC.5